MGLPAAPAVRSMAAWRAGLDFMLPVSLVSGLCRGQLPDAHNGYRILPGRRQELSISTAQWLLCSTRLRSLTFGRTDALHPYPTTHTHCPKRRELKVSVQLSDQLPCKKLTCPKPLQASMPPPPAALQPNSLRTLKWSTEVITMAQLAKALPRVPASHTGTGFWMFPF